MQVPFETGFAFTWMNALSRLHVPQLGTPETPASFRLWRGNASRSGARYEAALSAFPGW